MKGPGATDDSDGLQEDEHNEQSFKNAVLSWKKQQQLYGRQAGGWDMVKRDIQNSFSKTRKYGVASRTVGHRQKRCTPIRI